ncbi:ATP synthase F1 subunit delta [Lactobacillus terrae]|uniref:ATP synthase F1 subunit delta n=1 Tax=Lactobacillus terrae TaxID=2269374 RepID=UPI000C1B7B96|nr:ATP synthase F1 subunit delta [Lactobacillus terrae]
MKLSKFQVGKRYSRALYEVAQDNVNLDETLEEIYSLKAVFDENPELSVALSTRSISTKDKKNILDALSSQYSDLLKNFLSMVLDRDRMNAITEIVDSFVDRYDLDHGIVEATATTSVPLSKEQEESLINVVKQRFSVKQVNLKSVVDESILGGVILRVGDNVIDGSVIKKFNNIKNLLASN